ncbi:MAG: 50S ribosomal protein L5 [Planctomycetota bacterium]|nr:MAG: 50S ribosomal protein L5 [Planctomycetota bacterium]
MSEATLQKPTRERYAEVLDELCKQHGITNRLAAPRIEKICLNMGVGRAVQDSNILSVVSEHLTQLAGQKSTITLARKSVSNFRSRQGMKIGARVTLRGQRMWGFLDRLINLAIPRIKDFRGLGARSGFDKQGCYSLGLREQALFPEVVLDRLEHNQGLHVNIVIRNTTPDLSFELLKGIGMPFRER